jgi:hypothetical protein
MSKFAKLIAAIVGLLAIVLTDHLNVVPDGTNAEMISQAILAVLTAFGVYQVRNEQ